MQCNALYGAAVLLNDRGAAKDQGESNIELRMLPQMMQG